MIDRIMRAIRLDWTVFREIAEDQNAMSEAAIIVVIVSILSAIGSGLAAEGFFGAFVLALVATVIGWIAWAIVTYFVGTTFFQGKSDIPEMMRVLGYAMAPNLLGFFSFLGCIGGLIAFIGSILAFVAGFIAVREAMEFDTGPAILTVLIGWIVYFAISMVVGLVFGSAALLTGL
ncbi:MAG: YIP1 family protein [Anaerolineae bacterium]|jgi:hypothetical protein